MPEPRRDAAPPPSHEPADPAWLTDEQLAAQAPRLGRGRVLAALASLLLVAALLGWALPRLTGTTWAEIGGALDALPAWALPAAVLAGALALALEARTVQVAVTGSRYPAALQGHAAATAVSVAVPGGGIIGTFLLGLVLRRRGSALLTILVGVVAASLVELVIGSMLIPVLGLGSYAVVSSTGAASVDLPGGIGAAIATVLVALLCLGLLMLALRRGVLSTLLEQAGRLTDLPDLRDPAQKEADAALGPAEQEESRRAVFLGTVLEQRDRLVALLRRRPAGLLVPTLLARAVQLLSLWLALRAVGVALPLLLVVVVYALGRLLALVPLTPGGTGIAETAGAALLVAIGVPAAAAASAMLLLMVTTTLVPIAIGAVAAALLPRRRSASA
ncbi:flippase-like domain-containing protein [Brachybacterium squillarum]|uniref:flippase-like domain-containing protein n=1 Tax=Brachybacterium squillarum TaxID=661979 RepID=UPI002221C2A1|nr:flippase-like domain-containing protein [Brachybacterium squillarum]MCW1805407.1 flippase-like domain-containing protein [Brachybacterium squillarum]